MRTRAGSQPGVSPPAHITAEDTTFAYLSLTKAGSCGGYSKVDLQGITISTESIFNDFSHLVAVAGIFSLPGHTEPFK